MGGHAVKLIGWGTSEDGEDYWVYIYTYQKVSIVDFRSQFQLLIKIFSSEMFVTAPR